jgi:phytoene/squalene synthetase
MIVATKLPNPTHASSIDEAQTLVRRCAEPRPAGDQVKAAVRRASQRLNIPFSRVRDIWYGDARRIDAEEMDRLRQVAENAELVHAVAGIEVLRNRMLESNLPASRQVFVSLTAALSALGLHAEGGAPPLGREPINPMG